MDGGAGVALQADGKIVLAGTMSGFDQSGDYHSRFALARLNPNGSLDPSFDVDGKQTTDFNPDSISNATAVAIQRDGKIVVAGSVRVGADGWDSGLARYDADGSLDRSFAGDGTLTTGLGGSTCAVALQPDGKIVLAGQAGLARYLADGSRDPSFTDDGTLARLVGSVHTVAIRADGKIVVAGPSALARYLPDGSLDRSFGYDGSVPTGSLGARAAALQADGRIVVAGTIFVDDDFPDNEFALARYTADGALDTAFGSGGIQTTRFDAGWWQDDSATAVALSPSGKIIAAGTSTPVDWVWDGSTILLARYTANGSLDPAFGTRITNHGVYNSAADLALQGDGKIVLAGSGSDPGDATNNALVARYEGDPSVANAAPTARFAFGCSGLVCSLDASGSSDPDGTIAGYRWDFGDGTSASGPSVRKVFAQYATYSARLTVSDNAGATGERVETLRLLRLTARVSVVRGSPMIELSWNGSAGTAYSVYRDNTRISTVSSSAFTDTPPKSASRTYGYAVCQASGLYCTATETVHY